MSPIRPINIDFLPETSEQTKQAIISTLGSWQIEGLEPSPETIRDIELAALGMITFDQAAQRVRSRYKK